MPATTTTAQNSFSITPNLISIMYIFNVTKKQIELNYNDSSNNNNNTKIYYSLKVK